MNRSFVPWFLLAFALSGCDQGQVTSVPSQAKSAQQAAAQVTGQTASNFRAKSLWPFGAGEADPLSRSEFDFSAVIKRNYYVVFDASGSMSVRQCSGNETKLEVAKRALVEFSSRLPADANFGLLAFSDKGIRQLIPIGALDRKAVQSAIANVNSGGGTPLADAIRSAYAALTAQGRRQLGYGEYHLVVVTDGEATGEDPRRIVGSLLSESPVVLHTIGFCIGPNHSLNQPGLVVYRSATSTAELSEGFAEVLAEAPTFGVSSFK